MCALALNDSLCFEHAQTLSRYAHGAPSGHSYQCGLSPIFDCISYNGDESWRLRMNMERIGLFTTAEGPTEAQNGASFDRPRQISHSICEITQFKQSYIPYDSNVLALALDENPIFQYCDSLRTNGQSCEGGY